MEIIIFIITSPLNSVLGIISLSTLFVIIGNILATRIFERRDAKFERLRKEREEADARKKQIMEDSYKKKRAEKAKKKSEKITAGENNEK